MAENQTGREGRSLWPGANLPSRCSKGTAAWVRCRRPPTNDHHDRNFADLTLAAADVIAAQMPGLPAACVQVDEANIPGNPADGPLAAEAMNRVLDASSPGTERAVHFCFGNYGGQTIQSGRWNR